MNLEAAEFTNHDRLARELMKPLHRVRPLYYWSDLLLTCALGWFAFFKACSLPILSGAMLLFSAAAVAALYRALCFIHELSHLKPRDVVGFETAWNLLVGFPLLMPSIAYRGVHNDHHKLATYGTVLDPEYLPFGHSRRLTVVFALQSFLLPLLLLVRFLLLTPIGFLSPRAQNWLAIHASSLTMNVKYRREISAPMLRSLRRASAFIFLLWISAVGLALAGILPWTCFAVWLAVSSTISFLNTLRTLGAHAYESEGQPLQRFEQLLDSIDTPGTRYLGVWAPVGLRYHALHHYFPGIPYHNLREAHRILLVELHPDSAYRRATSPSLGHSLFRLLRRKTHALGPRV